MGTFVDKSLKRRYIDPNPDDLTGCVERASLVLKGIPKEQYAGDSVNVLAKPAAGNGNSYDIQAAQAITGQAGFSGGSDYETFTCPYGEYSGSVTISARAYAATNQGPARAVAFVDQLFVELDAELEAFGAIAARKLLGPIGGSIGRIEDLDQGGTAGESALFIQGDAFNFNKGMIVQAAVADGSSATITARAALGYIAQSDPSASTTGSSTTGWHVRLSASSADALANVTSAPAGWSDNDYIFRYGDIATNTDLSDKQIRSLQGFIPFTNVTTDYLGAKRTQRGMNGFRLSTTDTAGLSIKDRVNKLLTLGFKQFNARKVDTVVMNPDAWSELMNDMQTNGWQGFDGNLTTGASSLTLKYQGGQVNIISDPFCVASDIWAFTMDKLRIMHYDGFPRMLDADGLTMRLKANSNDWEIRWLAINSVHVGGQVWMHGRCDSGIALV